MIKKEIKKKKISPLVKTNIVVNPIRNKNSKFDSKKSEKKIPNKKTIKKKVRARSISAVAKIEPKNEQIKTHHSFKNSLELDYLNFSKLDLFKLDKSFEEDIFTPNYFLNNQKNNKKIILNRYEDSYSTINDNSTINNNNNKDNENIENTKQKEKLINTPSTICNYYDKSSNKKKEISKFNNDDIKKNLKDYYNINNSNNKEIEKDINNKNIIENENKDIKENKDIYNDNKINYFNKEEIKNNVINYSNISKQDKIIKQLNKNKKNISDGIKTFDYNPVENRINVNLINDKINLRKNSHQKAINLYYIQNKNEGYFITPRNINKINNDKNLSSTKSTKINTNSIGKAKSFSSKKINKTKYIKNNNLIYLNKNKIGDKISNYKIIKEIIKDNKEINNNKKYLNKTAPKNKNSNKDSKNNLNNLIKVNLKNKTKSSSNLNILKKQIISNENKIYNPLNNNKTNNNNINDKIKSEIKNSFAIFQNIYKTINKSGIKSPDKEDNNNLFKISKTLTEHNIIHKIQATPKNYKIQKFDSIPFTTIVKKIFIGSSKKDNLIQYDSSLKKQEKTKTEQMKIIFKPKTQSDFKPYNNILGNELFKKSNNGMNLDYGNDKHVKQKLLDRMNKATNNWNYIFKGNKNKKVLEDGISNLKSQNKEHYNYFYKNEGIISDGSEREDEEDKK